MREDLKNLYTQIIKAHNEKPFHFESIENASTLIKAYNSICGDRFDFFVDINSGTISNIHFYGFGCAISKASASVLTQLLEGKTLTNALSTCHDFLDFINQKLEKDELILPAEFRAFSGVHDFPGRYECAALAWQEMKKFLESIDQDES